MSESQWTGLIKIVKMPEGEAPVWVRLAWVDLILPCDPILGFRNEYGLLSHNRREFGKDDPTRRNFAVPVPEAMVILAKHSPQAAAWWQEPRQRYALKHHHFCFGEDEAEIISGVTIQEIIHVTEEMQGDPHR